MSIRKLVYAAGSFGSLVYLYAGFHGPPSFQTAMDIPLAAALTATQCDDDQDNDNDGKVDTLKNVPAGGTGDFDVVGATGGNWLLSITCRSANGSQQTFGAAPVVTGGVDETLEKLPGIVNDAMAAKNLPFKRLEDRGGLTTLLNDSPTRNAVCAILGFDSVVSFSTLLPNDGRNNYTSPHNNYHWRFTGTVSLPACSDGRDNDGDGTIDAQDRGCVSATDDDEREHDPECSDPSDDSEGPISVSLW